jgi:hypothetical protein
VDATGQFGEGYVGDKFVIVLDLLGTEAEKHTALEEIGIGSKDDVAYFQIGGGGPMHTKTLIDIDTFESELEIGSIGSEDIKGRTFLQFVVFTTFFQDLGIVL